MGKQGRQTANLLGVPRTLLERYHGPLFLGLILALGFAARLFLVPFDSGDINGFLIPWMEEIRQTGGLAALGNLPGNYTPPYIMLMGLFSYLPLQPLYAIKAISLAGDVFFAMAIYFLLVQVSQNKTLAGFGMAIVYMLPTVLLNSAAWGQCDAIYCGLLVLVLLFCLRGRPCLAMALFGAAVAFKQQALFLAPLVVLLVVLGRIRLREALASIAAYLLFFLPSILMGEPVSILWSIYLGQMKDHNSVAFNVSNLYSWLQASPSINRMFLPVYLLFGLCATGIFCYWLWLHRAALDARALYYAATFIAILVPFVMPKMHERYAYLADALAVGFALLAPRRWYVPVLCQLASLTAYIGYLFGKDPAIPAEYMALLPILALAAVGLTLREHFAVVHAAQASGEETVS